MSSCTDLILPTATALVGNVTIRMLRDTGAQMNFVANWLAEKAKFKVLETNVPLTIKGFNVGKKYVTKLVEIPLKLGRGIVY